MNELWTYTVNGAHEAMSAVEPPDDAYDEGSLTRWHSQDEIAMLKQQLDAWADDRLIRWFKIGDGARIHAVKDGANYSVCGIGGEMSGPFNPDCYDRCKTCVRKLPRPHSDA